MALLVPSPEISRVFCCPNPIPGKLKSIKIFTNEKKFGLNFRVRVCARVKDCEVRVSEGDQNLRLYGLFSAPVKQSSKPSKEEEEKQNYYVNMGYAIRTLREDFPDLFYRELSFDIFRFYFLFSLALPFTTFAPAVEEKELIFGRLSPILYIDHIFVYIISNSLQFDGFCMVPSVWLLRNYETEQHFSNQGT